VFDDLLEGQAKDIVKVFGLVNPGVHKATGD
jgi:hypothetical protein